MNELLSPEEILALDRIPAGMVRSSVTHPDGLVEGTAVNNLLAIHGALCTDFAGNRFGSYLIIPQSFWRRVKKELGEYHARDWRLLPKNRYGGYLGIISASTIYVMDIDFVVLKPDQGDLVFEFSVGHDHKITVSKEELIQTYGYERVGYDTRLTYVPWWTNSYAPPFVLLDWVKFDGYKPAKALLDNPPQDALSQWYNQAFIAAPVKEAVVALIEGRKYYPPLPPGTIDAEEIIP